MKKEAEDYFTPILLKLYPDDVNNLIREISHLLTPLNQKRKEISQEDMILLAYPDHIFKEGTPTLQTIKEIVNNDFTFLNTIHILPFHPSTSDGGFAVSDYNDIDSKYGDWNDIEQLAKTKKIMCDVVLNHVSSKHEWFIKCQKGDLYYKEFFHTFNKIPYKPDIFRARTTPLFTPKIIEGKEKYVWTTFSADQIDINFSNPHPLIHYLRIIRNYATHNVSRFRLDAIAYIIKEKTGVHQEKTFLILELLNKFIKELNPHNLVIPEVNFSLENNEKYLDKSDVIYHFELPALLLHSFYNQNSATISNWLCKHPCKENKFFLQFTSTHDGLALLGVKKILAKKEFNKLVQTIEQNQAIISYKTIGNSVTPYEADGLFSVMINNPKAFISCKLITLALKGIPLFYFPDFFPLNNWVQGYKDTNQPRNLSRQKFSIRQYEMLREFMSEPLRQMSHAAHIRSLEPIFHPQANQEIIAERNDLIIIRRFNKTEELYAITNVTNKDQTINLKNRSIDILTHTEFENHVIVKAFDTVWCKVETTNQHSSNT